MSQTPKAIAEDCVVGLNYTLKNNAGVVLDRSDAGEPLYYLHGHDNIVPGLERKLTGRAVGDKMQVVVQPGDGYGERDPKATKSVPSNAFPPGLDLAAGMQLGMRDASGRIVPIWITKVEGKMVDVDMNHPLAGEVLHFEVEVTSIRAATKDELSHGHPHGPDGHHHH